MVTSVQLHREGGLKPTTVDRLFAADQPPPEGYTAAQVADVLASAQQFTDAGIKLKPLPINQCCDQYTYNVTITYSDGKVKAFTTIDSVRQPKPFQALLSALSSP